MDKRNVMERRNSTLYEKYIGSMKGYYYDDYQTRWGYKNCVYVGRG
jgi:hypothetical protein